MAPTPAEARAVTASFVDMVNRRDFDGVQKLFAPDAKWIVVANATKADWGGSNPAVEMCKRAEALLATFDTWSYTAKDIIVDVEGTRAVVEGMAKGRGPGSLTYDNQYLKRFIFDECGKIKELKEQMDAYEVDILFEQLKRLPQKAGTK